MPLSFYILALFTLASAVCAMALRNLVHCALSLALAFLGVAGLFLRMNAGFVAFAQILVYVGAVAILIVFAILLTRNSENGERYSLRNVVIAIPLAASLGALVVSAVFRTNLAASAQPATAPSPQEIGASLMTTYLIPLELIGVLLTVALLGAVVLALPEQSNRDSGAPPA
jgi:NADH:ubiquinone oxidoreductase subunit 6 (subunit J)